jgi:hypothetical protein
MSTVTLEVVSLRLDEFESKNDLFVQQKIIKEWYTTAEVAAILGQNLQRLRGAPC